jgi:putative transposase
MREAIAIAMRNIFNSPSLETAKSMVTLTANQYEKSAPEFVRWLEDNIWDGLTCYNFPEKHRKKIRTSNGIERVNREIKRRTRVAVLFPNDASAIPAEGFSPSEISEDFVDFGEFKFSISPETANFSIVSEGVS